MYVWKLTRNTIGYEELMAVFIVAEDEKSARMKTVLAHRSQNGVVDFLDPDYATAVAIGTANETVESGYVYGAYHSAG